MAVAFTLAVAGAAGLFAMAGATVAGAASSSRATGLLTRAHGHGFSPSEADSRTAGSDIIALVVAILAVSAVVFLIVFLIVTYVRHRRG